MYMKKITLTKLLLLLVVVLLVASCKKDTDTKDSNSSYVKFKLNGDWVTYKWLGELGPDLGDATLTDLGISGYSDDQKNTFNISIQINGTNFTTGTYLSDQYPLYRVVVSLFLRPEPSTGKYYQIENALDKDPSKYTVKINSITPSQIKGTFTGNYLSSISNQNDPDGGVIYVTEGEFQVKRIR